MYTHESPPEGDAQDGGSGDGLGERLQHEVEEGREALAEKQRAREAAAAAARQRRTLGLGAILLLLVGFAGWQIQQNAIAPDQSGRVADIAPTSNLHMEKELKWVATMEEGWEGLTDSAVAEHACADMLAELAPYPDGLTHIVLKAPTGAEIATCRVDDTAAYLQKVSTRYAPAQASVDE